MRVRVRSQSRMSNRRWHAAGKPCWWVRVGSGEGAQFLRIPQVRGDEYLDVEVEVPDDVQELHIGVGPRGVGVRETVRIKRMSEPA